MKQNILYLRNYTTQLVKFAFIFTLTNIYSVTVNAYDIKVGDFYYNLMGDEVEVDCYSHDSNRRPYLGDCYTSSEYTIPSSISYNGLTYIVRGINDYAFATSSSSTYESFLKKITLPASLTYFGDDVFSRCKNLITVTIPPLVNSMGFNIFRDCSNLRQVIYTPPVPPTNWVACANTYVPSATAYSTPRYTLNNPRIIEMITWEQTEFIYNGCNQSLPNYICNIPDYNVTLDAPILEKEVGAYTINVHANFYKGTETFEVDIPFRYSILPKNVIVKANHTSRVYGDDNPSFEIIYDGLVDGETCADLQKAATVICAATKASNVGTYPITVSGAKAQNYSFNYESGELTIVPAPLSATVASVSREYGYTNPNFTLIFEGLKNGEATPAWIETPSFNTTATLTSHIGEYTITATALPKNYSLTKISDGVLTILPAKLRVTAQNKSRLYFEENPEFTFNYSGFRNGETESVVSKIPTLTTSATIGSASGKYDILISEISAPNYEIQYQTGVLTIQPRKLTVKTGSYERPYGEENPLFELEYQGFVRGEGVVNLTTVPSAYTSAIATSSVGSYPVYIDGGEAQNYSFSYSHGNLNIVKAEQEIVWNQELTNLAVGQQIELLAYSSSELPISYTIDDNDCCDIYSVGNKKYLDCLKEGEIQLRATQEGNSNYHSARRVVKNLAIGHYTSDKPTLIISQIPIGSMSSPVDWGSSYTFTIKTNEGWSVNAISINGEDYTNRMDSNGTFTTPFITDDTNIIISYYDENSSIASPGKDKVRILGNSNGIRVLNASNGERISIYTMEGDLVKSITIDNNDMFVPLQNNIIYIIKTGELTVKIRL